MRHVLSCLALLAIAASPRGGGCGSPAYEPCAGKACGVTCSVCDPADRSCVETAVVKACDASGACVPAATANLTCPAPYAPCAGKACGTACALCAPWDTGCVETSVLKVCDPTGRCVPSGGAGCEAPPPPPVDPCAGKACGASCNPCGDLSPCPTLAATACDRSGQCVTATPALCYDPCLGKAPGASCSPCPPGSDCTTLPCLWTCQASGACSCAGSPVW